jgi:hypothetical protein
MHKPLQIQPPHKLTVGNAGVDCCLVLSPSRIVTSSVIDLRDPDLGKMPLSMRLLPVRTKITAIPTTTKPEAIIRTCRLYGDNEVGTNTSTPLTQVKGIQETVGMQHHRNCETVE